MRPAWLVLALLLTACAPLAPYHTDLAPCETDQDIGRCADHVLEVHPEYTLAFVELDDQGWFWDRRQMWAVVDHLSEAVHARDQLMVVFVHGWKHNAQACDGNVACFRETLRRIHHLETRAAAAQGRAARAVTGIYVGWRGLSLDAGPLTNLSFWDRKHTADRVGHGALVELLARLDSIRTIRREITGGPEAATQLVIVGHSFGGQVVFSALSQLMVERAVDIRGSGQSPQGFGDLVVLVNPAFEAKRFENLRQLAAERSYFPGQRPLLAILTSRGDKATRYAFPAGRFFSTLTQAYRDREQFRADLYAVGHYAPYRTHRLEARGPVQDLSEEADRPCACRYLARESELRVGELEDMLAFRRRWLAGELKPGWSVTLPGAVLRHDPARPSHPLNPYLVVSVDDRVIHGHNDIYRPAFIQVLRQLLVLSAPLGPNERAGD